jgi:hypothetical protein
MSTLYWKLSEIQGYKLSNGIEVVHLCPKHFDARMLSGDPVQEEVEVIRPGKMKIEGPIRCEECGRVLLPGSKFSP